ncbi:MAG: putative rane protein [Herbinix sp.]|jgi:stage III sporulation protein AH|nr:putative rane protein [Herbinix sp.]
MKNIFKKNQIIITALAIMIAIAGYLTFTNDDKPEEGVLQTANPDLEDYDIYSELNGDVLSEEGTDLATATGTDDTGAADDTTVTDDATTDENNETTATDEDTTLDDTATDDAEATDDAAEDADAVDDEADELGDISDEDLQEMASVDVSDSGELDSEGVPGEAVLASTTLDAGYFYSAKLEREQVRAKSREDFNSIIESEAVSEAQKQAAIDGMIELIAISEKEDAAEMLLQASGFSDAVVRIDGEYVDVVINAENITDQQVAKIEDIVKRKTDSLAENIVITPVVVED